MLSRGCGGVVWGGVVCFIASSFVCLGLEPAGECAWVGFESRMESTARGKERAFFGRASGRMR